MHRFFLSPDTFGSPRVIIVGEVAEQIHRVLRMRPGDPIILLDGLGYEYRGALHSYRKGDVWVDVGERIPVTTEARVSVTLYLSLLNKPDKYEWALQKCTELGAARFVPVVTERSVTHKFSETRRERWARIIREAAEQSGRAVIPVLDDPITMRDALAVEVQHFSADSGDRHLSLMPEVGQNLTLRIALSSGTLTPATLSLLIGPEGGFTQAEVDSATSSGIIGVTLGPRILRAETAAVASLAVIMAELGEMD